MAADLQKKHSELEGAPDPFPSINSDAPPTQSQSTSRGDELDTESQTAFPSLAPSPAPSSAPARPAWGSASGPRIKPTPKAPTFSESFQLTDIDLSSAGKEGKPTTLGEVMKAVMHKYKVKIEASTNQRTRQTTFHLKADSQKELDKAKRNLLASLSPVVTLVINAPASTIPTIIGPKGATLNKVRDQTNVKVDIPRKDTLSPPVNGPLNGKVTPTADEDEDEEPTVPVTLTGPRPLALEARELLNQIIATKTSRTAQRVRDIPPNVLPFVIAHRPFFQATAAGGDVQLSLNQAEREVTVSGERSAVGKVVDAIRSTIDGLKGSLTSLKISLPKRQHRLLVGKAAEEILAKSKCAVFPAAPDDASDEVTVWGQPVDLSSGLGAVMERANSQYIHEFPLPGPITLSKHILTYMTRIGYTKTLAAAHSGVSVFTPPESVAEKASVLNLDIVGDKPAVDGVVRQVSELIGKLIGAFKEVNIDWLVHRVITGKNAKKIKQFHDTHNVNVYFPPESQEQSAVLLVYDPFSPSASPSPLEKEKHLEEVSKEVLKLAKEAADVKGQSVAVDKKWHDAVVGQGGTTLNAIIGEDKTLSIKVGAEAGEASEDVILVRGAAADVDRAVKEILQIVEDAKNDEIVNSYSTEFDIDKEFVGRVVGAQGSGINKLRDLLGVKVDVSDDVDDKEVVVGKKKKAVHQKCRVKITGRKENVEEAKKRILTQIERLADETSEVLKIPSQYHSSLIGSSGKYAIRLEEKYGVKITFPRHSAENGEGKTREVLKSDEVLVKGGKKGVAGAKSELLEAVEFEKESNNVIKFTVPTRSVARILGKGGANINEIKDSTDAQVDVDKASDNNGSVTNITIRGSKKAIAAAKAAIMEIADQVGEEIEATVKVESRFHRTLIGAGGQGLRDLVTRSGGPADPKQQAGLIRFPRQGEPSDEVRLRGEPKLVKKLQAELEKVAAEMRDRVVLVIDIPAAQHRALIGRGGQHLNDLQARTGAQVQFPGSRSYHQVGEPENNDDVSGSDPANLVKVTGSRAACEKAMKELKAQAKPPPPEAITAKVSVPLKYHHVISQQGGFFRTLRTYGVQVDQSAQPQKSAIPPQPASGAEAVTARIDEADEDVGPDVQWQVAPNYQDAEEGDSEWTLKARDQAGLGKAEKAVKEAIDHAAAMSHVGFLRLPDRSAFPRIVGSKGANVARLRAETGADITVSRESSDIVIIGDEAAIVTAKDAILKMISGGGGGGRPGRRQYD